MRGAALVAQGMGVLFLAACSDAGSVKSGCTLIGDESGLDVSYTQLERAYPRQALTLEICAADICETKPQGTRRPTRHLVRIIPEAFKDETPVPIRVRITDERGEVVFAGQTTVTPVKFQVNGEGCGPTTFRAMVVATGRDTLTEATLTR